MPEAAACVKRRSGDGNPNTEGVLKPRLARPSSAPALPAHRARQARFWATRKAMRQDRQEKLAAMRPASSRCSMSSSSASSVRHWTRALGEAQALERSQRRAAAEGRKKVDQLQTELASSNSRVVKVSLDKVDLATRQMLMPEVTLQKLEYLYRQIRADADRDAAGCPAVMTHGSDALSRMLSAEDTGDAVAAAPTGRCRDVAAEARAARAKMMRPGPDDGPELFDCGDFRAAAGTSCGQDGPLSRPPTAGAGVLRSRPATAATRSSCPSMSDVPGAGQDVLPREEVGSSGVDAQTMASDAGGCANSGQMQEGATRISNSGHARRRPSTATGHGRPPGHHPTAGSISEKRPRPATAESTRRRQSCIAGLVRASRPVSGCRTPGPSLSSRPPTATTAAASRPLSGVTTRSSSGFSVRSTPSSYPSPAMLLAPSSSAPRLMSTPGKEFGDLPESYYAGDERFMLEDILHSTNPEVFPLRSGPDRLFPLNNLVAC